MRKYIGNVCKYVFNSDTCKVLIFHNKGMSHDECDFIRPTSAGFLRFYNDKNNELAVYCYGNSESLGLKSDEKDSEIITRLIGVE
jgi:hypothetical protein